MKISEQDIGTRLENWARWATMQGARGADSMTGAVCERMRKAALGNVWSGHEVRDSTDSNDAWTIQHGMAKITLQQRLILHWHYIERARPEIICRMTKIPARPLHLFSQLFKLAQEEIERVIDNKTHEEQNSAQQLISV